MILFDTCCTGHFRYPSLDRLFEEMNRINFVYSNVWAFWRNFAAVRVGAELLTAACRSYPVYYGFFFIFLKRSQLIMQLHRNDVSLLTFTQQVLSIKKCEKN